MKDTVAFRRRGKVGADIRTDDLIAAAHETEFGMASIGFCVDCGAQVDGVEPDARAYPCYSCGARGVYGAPELLLTVSP